jgi:hypothetical protein
MMLTALGSTTTRERLDPCSPAPTAVVEFSVSLEAGDVSSKGL